MEISKKSLHYRFVHWTFGDFDVEASIFTYIIALVGAVWVLPIRACVVGVKDNDLKNVLPATTMSIGLLFGAFALVGISDATGAAAITSDGINTPPKFIVADILVVMAIIVICRVAFAIYNACLQVRVKFT